MIFADKLIQLRKKSGWSQEEFAAQMEVSRQSVSKWEGAQSIPDMNKLIRISEIFGVSLDYLLKDEIEDPGTPAVEAEKSDRCRTVSMEECRAFLDVKRRTAPVVALGTLLCILSFLPMLALGVLSRLHPALLPKNTAGALGMIIMLVSIAVAVTLFILVYTKTSKFEYLDKAPIDTAYGVSGLVKEEQEKYRDTYNRGNIVGTVLCILCILPLMCGILVNEKSDGLMVSMICLMFVMIAVAVYIFIRVGIVWASFQKLLQEGDYTAENKRISRTTGLVAGVYWVLAVAIFLTRIDYLTSGFITAYWGAAALLYAAVHMITRHLSRRKK